MAFLKQGDTVGIVACSDGKAQEYKTELNNLKQVLEEEGLKVVCSQYIFSKKGEIFSGTGKQKAQALMKMYTNTSIKAIFDVSAGDLANEVLPWINFEVIKKNPKPFFGYSDLTVVLNGIYAETGQPAFLYQINNLVWERGKVQKERFRNSMMEDKEDLFQITTNFIQGSYMKGEVVGGNIRCFLKLAGTGYMPDFQDKILFLESMSGDVESLTSYLVQMKMMGIFEKIQGVLLGTFTEMERRRLQPTINKMVQDIVDKPSMPIAKTREIGHGTDSKCLIIGGIYQAGEK